ncbi:uncharacterized protein LOC111410594 [Olea europaea var. sylvestris]|uniref:uncharacterized protein LOC111410594 n=1 Tax=Olea europaea var. sylvestris TaxID=158386 RepID=UPI000C1D2740|nr:uncharacterized protein LOC111410594 [Olea europaea var. sylvestris]
MDVEVAIPLGTTDFNFDSACTSPYISVPSSPQRFGTFFYSVPTSPDRAAAFYNEFNRSSPSAVPFNREEKPGIPKTQETYSSYCTREIYDDQRDTDFSFDFSGQLERVSLSADELFDGGKIKPLKPPPCLESKPLDFPKSPRSPKKMIKEAFSPRHRKKDFDPFAAAIEQNRKENIQEISRGRERSTSSSRHKQTRSLSPSRVSDLLFDPDTNQEKTKNSSKASLFSSLSSLCYKKWKIKDLLLFRSASESRATDKNQFNKYALLKKNNLDDIKNSSFRSTDSVGSLSSRRRGPPISAHELYYTVRRAVSEEMKKRTFLPYRQGLLGCCLGFNPNTIQGMNLSKGLGPTGSLSRG